MKLAFGPLTSWTDDSRRVLQQNELRVRTSVKIKPMFSVMFRSVKSPTEKANIPFLVTSPLGSWHVAYANLGWMGSGNMQTSPSAPLSPPPRVDG